MLDEGTLILTFFIINHTLGISPRCQSPKATLSLFTALVATCLAVDEDNWWLKQFAEGIMALLFGFIVEVRGLLSPHIHPSLHHLLYLGGGGNGR
jgi:hypothetical protein